MPRAYLLLRLEGDDAVAAAVREGRRRGRRCCGSARGRDAAEGRLLLRRVLAQLASVAAAGVCDGEVPREGDGCSTGGAAAGRSRAAAGGC